MDHLLRTTMWFADSPLLDNVGNKPSFTIPTHFVNTDMSNVNSVCNVFSTWCFQMRWLSKNLLTWHEIRQNAQVLAILSLWSRDRDSQVSSFWVYQGCSYSALNLFLVDLCATFNRLLQLDTTDGTLCCNYLSFGSTLTTYTQHAWSSAKAGFLNIFNKSDCSQIIAKGFTFDPQFGSLASVSLIGTTTNPTVEKITIVSPGHSVHYACLQMHTVQAPLKGSSEALSPTDRVSCSDGAEMCCVLFFSKWKPTLRHNMPLAQQLEHYLHLTVTVLCIAG